MIAIGTTAAPTGAAPVSTVPQGPPRITLTRIDESVSPMPEPISPEEAAADPDIRAAVEHVTGFDRWLRSHGRDGWNDAGGDIVLQYVDRADEASFDMTRDGRRGWISLGTPTETYARSPGASPVIIGHELMHGVTRRLPLHPATREAIGDVAGHSYAAWIGYPAGTHWRMADEVLRPPRLGSGLRDAANPVVPDVDAVVRQHADPDSMVAIHLLAGPVGAAAVAIERAVGPQVASAIWGQALLHELPRHVGGPVADRAPAEVPGYARAGLNQLLADLDALARSTRDAAALVAPGSAAVAEAVDQAWRGVGIGQAPIGRG